MAWRTKLARLKVGMTTETKGVSFRAILLGMNRSEKIQWLLFDHKGDQGSSCLEEPNAADFDSREDFAIR